MNDEKITIDNEEVDVSFLDCLGVIKIRPGDTVVLRLKERVNDDRRQTIKLIAEILQDQYKCRMLVLDDVLDIGVLKSDG